uniref:quinone oxidoreductase family protein n=1 Tax=Caballeronia sp. LjRoot34 TaxID=3342325 RepID=UPI003F507DE1
MPVPAPNQILIRVEAVSVNYADIVRRRNNPYPVPTPLPAILGGEVAGFVEALGSEVRDLAIGDRVFALLGGGGKGGYAQFSVADRAQVMPLPSSFDLDIACTLVVAGVTAYQVLKEAAQLQPGESVFIPGVLGGVGSYALQLARIFGASNVIAGASSAERRELLMKRGASHTVDYTVDDWAEQVKQVTSGKGADVVLDMAGGKAFQQSLSALAPFGRLVIYGSASREPATLAPRALLTQNQTVTGYYVGQWFAARPRQSIDAFNALIELVVSGKLNVQLASRLPLSGAAEAHRTMEARRSTGKIVLKPWIDS